MCCAVPPLPPSPRPLRARNEEGGDDGYDFFESHDGYDACGVREAERWRGDERGDRVLMSNEWAALPLLVRK